jgi:hypothetical protein
LNGSVLVAGKIVLKEGWIVLECHRSGSISGTFDTELGFTSFWDGRMSRVRVVEVGVGVFDEKVDIGSIKPLVEGSDVFDDRIG